MTYTLVYRDPRLHWLPTLPHKVLYRILASFPSYPPELSPGRAMLPLLCHIHRLRDSPKSRRCQWVDTPIFQPPAPIRPPVSFRAIEMELLVWKMIGISLPRYQHMEKSGLSPKLGSFHLKTGVAFWEGGISATPKPVFAESSHVQMTNMFRMGCSSPRSLDGGTENSPTAYPSSETASCAHSSTKHGAQENTHSDHWTLKSPFSR